MSSLHTYSICVIKLSISKAIEQIPSENRRFSQNVTDHSCWHAVFTLYWTLFISFTSYYYKVLNCRNISLQLGPEESSVLIFQSSKLILRSSLVCEVNNKYVFGMFTFQSNREMPRFKRKGPLLWLYRNTVDILRHRKW